MTKTKKPGGESLVRVLKSLRACDESVAWAKAQKSAASAWASCERGDWMLWILYRLAGDDPATPARRALALLRAKIARETIATLQASGHEIDPRTINVVDKTEAWGRGDSSVSLDILRAARSQSSAARREAWDRYYAARSERQRALAAAAAAADAAADADAAAADADAAAAAAADAAADAAAAAAAAAAADADAAAADADADAAAADADAAAAAAADADAAAAAAAAARRGESPDRVAELRAKARDLRANADDLLRRYCEIRDAKLVEIVKRWADLIRESYPKPPKAPKVRS